MALDVELGIIAHRGFSQTFTQHFALTRVEVALGNMFGRTVLRSGGAIKTRLDD